MKCKFSPIKMGLIFGILFLGLLSFSLTTWAQSTTDGAIGGTVTDPSGAVVPGASHFCGQCRLPTQKLVVPRMAVDGM